MTQRVGETAHSASGWNSNEDVFITGVQNVRGVILRTVCAYVAGGLMELRVDGVPIRRWWEQGKHTAEEIMVPPGKAVGWYGTNNSNVFNCTYDLR